MNINGTHTFYSAVKNGEMVKEPDDPSPPQGLIFDGWYKDGAKYDFSNTAYERDFTLYAKWIEDETFYTCTFKIDKTLPSSFDKNVDFNGGNTIFTVIRKKGRDLLRS